jgi:uncharacterized protein (TIGR02246 family)
MRLIALLIGGCLTATGALAQSKTEMQQMLDDLAAAFNKGDAAKVALYYKSDATLFPPGSDMLQGRQNIEQFWKKRSEVLGDCRFEVTNVESLGPNASREQGYAWCKTKGGNAQEWFLKRSMEIG